MRDATEEQKKGYTNRIIAMMAHKIDQGYEKLKVIEAIMALGDAPPPQELKDTVEELRMSLIADTAVSCLKGLKDMQDEIQAELKEAS